MTAGHPRGIGPERPIDSLVKKTLADLYKRRAELEATIRLLESKLNSGPPKASPADEKETGKGIANSGG